MASRKNSEKGYIREKRSGDGARSFLAQLKVKGFKRVAKSFPTKDAAAEWREKMRAELLKQRERGTVRADVSTLTIAQLATEYLADPETKAQKAYNDRAAGIAWWVNHFGSERVLSFNVLKIRDARTRLQPKRANATVNRFLAAMRACWNWGRAAGLVPQDLQWPSRLMLTEPKGRTRYLTDDEIAALLAAAKSQGPVMHAAVLVSIATGLRKGELLRLTWADVDFAAQSLRILRTKNGEARGVHIPPSAVAALQTLKKATVVGASCFLDDDGQPIGQGWIEYRWKQVIKDSGVRNFRWHDLRHSCASILAQNGASLPEIGSVLGHQSASATYRYSHLIDGKIVKGHSALDAKLSGK